MPISTLKTLPAVARERFLESILDSATVIAIITTDRNGVITHWNSGAENTLGWRETEAVGQPTSLIYTPEDRLAGVPAEEMAAARATGHAADERWHMRKDGTRFFASGSMMPLNDEATGAPIGFLKILRDRTEQRQTQERLRRSEERLQLAIAAAGTIGIWDWDLIEDIVVADETLAVLYGIDPVRAAAGVPSEECEPAIHPDDRPGVRAALRAALKFGVEFNHEYRLVRPDGSARWVLARGRVVLDEEGRRSRFPGVTVDISERKASEEALARAEARSRLAQKVGQVGVFEMDLESGMVSGSEEMFRILGLPDDRPRPAAELVALILPEDRHLALIGETPAAATAEGNVEYRVRRPDTGEIRWIARRAGYIRDAAGKPVKATGIVQDITDRKQGEEEREVLAGELQHRIKNMLAVVQAIASQTFRSADTKEAAVKVFTDRLVALSRAHDVLTQASWTAAQLHDLLRSALLSHRAGDERRFGLSGPPVQIAAKPALALTLVMHELATNAVKYGALSQPGGHVDIRWEARPAEAGGTALRLVWRETGGPPVSPPTRKGFGSRLIERGVSGGAGDRVSLDFVPDGLVCTIEAMLAG